ncbi:FAD-dependent monooxygenase [Streptomyces zhihengii]|uniref:FAD-dependent monooxygenase n=1 Tax=Streptomyces zhihengii TaxID=1818004 RepID=A0ABS2V4P9_9ACTN|nr:FAD-dependent monooxygenase [Streptomyces zhihengii]MBM9624598.1 FAD-dependent monooxygenase [Streptomyces zhihengii]
MADHTAVAIVGAGPAGLLLANRLLAQGLDCTVFERRSRRDLEQLPRAGLLTPASVAVLDRNNLAASLRVDSTPHTTCAFRIDGRETLLAYARYARRHHTVYAQHHLVRDLISTYLDAGGDLRFSTPCTAVTDLDNSPHATVHTGAAAFTCTYVVGCDGSRGVSRGALAPYTISHHSADPWVAVLAACPPSVDHITYALHPDGFAGHMLRDKVTSRFYLQCNPAETTDDWPAERIWEQLRRRLSLSQSSWSLTEGPILSREVVNMTSEVSTRLQRGRLYLVGDAAHTVSPAGAKGLNLALADADHLATALITALQKKDERQLNAYSEDRLPHIWQAQQFSHEFLNLLNTPHDPFRYQLNSARLGQLFSSPSHAVSFALDYTR